MRYDYDGSGKERELVASVHTLMIYEQQFKAGLIEDVFGRIELTPNEDDIDENGNLRVADYTRDHWGAYVKALWAMLRAGADLARIERRDYEPIPGYEEWSIRATHLDMAEISRIVVTECQRELFRSGAAASEGETSNQ
jgi:hypothetical protein